MIICSSPDWADKEAEEIVSALREYTWSNAYVPTFDFELPHDEAVALVASKLRDDPHSLLAALKAQMKATIMLAKRLNFLDSDICAFTSQARHAIARAEGTKAPEQVR